MRPYLVQDVRAPDQSLVEHTAPTVLGQVILPQVAQEIATMMENVTHSQQGTAFATAGPDVTTINIAGKTGTAQNGTNNTGLDDAVFSCFAQADSANPQIAVGVIVNHGGFGAAAAAPIALKIIQAYLGRN
jgi:penicillin-binding protein A